MEQLQVATIHCPYCGERLQLWVDLSVGNQSYIEDCQVCCRPIELRLGCYPDRWQLEAFRDDE